MGRGLRREFPRGRRAWESRRRRCEFPREWRAWESHRQRREFPRERRACVGHEWRWACGNRERQRAGSGSGPDSPQTPEDTFPPTQSGGVWEVHGTVVVGPEPEQFIQGGVIPRRRKLAELPGVLVEGEPLTG